MTVNEDEVGGFVKTIRTKPSREDRPGKNKTPRHILVQPDPGQIVVLEKTRPAQASVAVLPAISTEKPSVVAINSPKKNIGGDAMETKKTEATVVITAQTHRLQEPCCLCGYGKSIVPGKHFLVCKADDDRYNDYVDRVSKEIVRGNKNLVVLSKIEWVLSRINLDLFDKELAEARTLREPQRVHEIRQRATEKANADSKAYLKKNNKPMPAEIFRALIPQYQKKEMDDLYHTIRRLNARLETAKKIKPELEQKIAERANNTDATVPTALTVAPAPAPAA